MPSELDEYLSEITKKYTAIGKRVASELQSRLKDADYNDIPRIIRKVWAKYDVPKEYRNTLLDGIVSATGLGVDIPNPISFRAFAEKSVSLDGVKLSTKINDISRTDEIETMIKNAMRNDVSIYKVAVDLVNKDISASELPKYVDDLISKMRQAATVAGDTEAYSVYRRAVSRVNRQVESLVRQDTSALARAYHDISELSVSASEKLINKTIERAIMVKSRSNALRLAHTETARAYGNARVESIRNDDDSVGIKVTLSGAHDGYCICDFFAESDMYGMGEGVYPDDQLPSYPFHPYCQCLLDPVYKSDINPDEAEYDDSLAKAVFDDLDESEQAALVGKEGLWEDLDWKDHKLPEGYSEEVSK